MVIETIQGIKRIDPTYNAIYVSRDGRIRKDLACEDIKGVFVQNLDCREVRWLVKKYRPDIIHAHGYTASVICALSMVKVPIISHLHGNPPWIRQLTLRIILYGLCSKRFKCIIAVSAAVLRENIFYNALKTKAIIQHNPVDICKIKQLASLGNDSEKYDIAFVGSFREAKNPLGFIKIVAEINKRMPVKAVMIGDGVQREAVFNEIRKCGVQDIIKLTGNIDNPFKYLCGTKVLCAPRKWEGYGLAIAEALVLGKPVIASPVGGIPELLKNGGGVLCSTIDEFVDTVIELLKDEELYLRLSQEALENARQLCSIEEYSRDILKIYEKIVHETL